MQTAAQEWRMGWRTMVAGFFGMAAMTSVPTVLGVVMQPIVAETGWPRSLIAAQIFILSAATLFLAPVAGWIVRRYGVRRYALLSITAAAPALVLVTLASTSAATWIAVWVLYAIINVGLGPLMWSTAVSELFDKARGLALAVTLSGAGLAYAIQPLAVLVERAYGWRAVYGMLAIIFLVFLLPLCLRWFKSKSDIEGSNPLAAAGHVGSIALNGLTLGEAMKTRQFWQLAAICFLVAAVEGAFIVNLFPILTEGGLDRTTAGTMGFAMGVSMVVGRLATGAGLDRFPPLVVLAVAIGVILVSAFLAGQYHGAVGLAAAISVLLGLGGGGITGSLAYLAGRYFGLVAYASVFGLLMGLFAIGYGIAPIFANLARDATGTYHAIFPVLVGALGVAVALTLSLGKPSPRLAAA